MAVLLPEGVGWWREVPMWDRGDQGRRLAVEVGAADP